MPSFCRPIPSRATPTTPSPAPEIRRARFVADADGDERKSRDLTPKEWAEEMDAARIAPAHDIKLDLIEERITPSM